MSAAERESVHDGESGRSCQTRPFAETGRQGADSGTMEHHSWLCCDSGAALQPPFGMECAGNDSTDRGDALPETLNDMTAAYFRASNRQKPPFISGLCRCMREIIRAKRFYGSASGRRRTLGGLTGDEPAKSHKRAVSGTEKLIKEVFKVE